MKHVLVLLVFWSAVLSASSAQTTAKPSSTAKPATTGSAPTVPGAIKLPPGIPRGRGLVKTAFALRYQDLKVGTGAATEPNKVYKVLYSGWLASNGHKFDSSEDHRQPMRDKDGKPVMGDDGKPKLGDVQPFMFTQGTGRVMPGFDQGFEGMKVGGKRRLFIPWQLAYGVRGRPGPDPANPGIPPKADLIFDVELVDMVDMPMPPNRPIGNPVRPGASLPGVHMNGVPPAGAPPATPGATAPQAPTATPGAPATTVPSTPPANAKPTTPPPAQQPQP